MKVERGWLYLMSFENWLIILAPEFFEKEDVMF
jgi:hypothetical protein